MPLVTCNLVGSNGTLNFFGASRIYDAIGEELVQAEEEGYIYAEIDTSEYRALSSGVLYHASRTSPTSLWSGCCLP
ncbi:hypothetical protein [Aneurinibacillus migulanus]|uniref:hypothetical protein n=1 Tax=Aneurinibacillus migulanus TaxID=47500 RepID=UPI0013792E83|nr:hypothetical protein [Aneurinibacillus migulanus]MCP1356243.1 hypothetical protein [Aneurinibacillus migulanus]MED4731478.1 hypothetical protein [Aneurinibacillus migulanus]